MVTTQVRTSSTADKMYGLFYASLVATVMFAVFDVGAAALMAPPNPNNADYFWAYLFLYLWLGGLVSLVIFFLLGMSVWVSSEALGYHTRTHAAAIGAGIGGALSLAFLFLFLDHPVWLVIRMAWTIATGAVAGLVARVVAGPFSQPAGTPDSPAPARSPPQR